MEGYRNASNFSFPSGPRGSRRGPLTVETISEGETVTWCFFYALVGVVTILGNWLTIAVFLKKKFKRKKLHYTLINLAITDLTVGAISVPLQIVAVVWNFRQLRRPQMISDIHYFFDILSGLTSMYSIAFISIERLVAVSWPLQHRLLRRWHYAVAISLTWFIAAVVAVSSRQILPKSVSRLADLNIRTVFALIPIIVTFTAYCTLWYIRRGCEARGRSEKYNKHIACTLLIVTIIFFFTWIPYIILSSTVGYLFYFNKCCSFSLKTYVFVIYLTKLLQYSNSCVNPFIYTLRIPAFRAEAWKILFMSKRVRARANGTRQRHNLTSTSSSFSEPDKRFVSDMNMCENVESKPHRSRTMSSTDGTHRIWAKRSW